MEERIDRDVSEPKENAETNDGDSNKIKRRKIRKRMTGHNGYTEREGEEEGKNIGGVRQAMDL